MMFDPQEPWRLIWSPPMAGRENMALDEALLETTMQGDAPPTLRLYAWDPPCLSIGYAQPIDQVDRQAVHRRGWDLVRRPTGGRAILHTDELTYAVVATDHGPVFAGGVLPSYRRLSAPLAHGLRSMGLDVQVQEAAGNGSPAAVGPVCFQTPSAQEITVDGRKLLGSAQLRRRGAALQHGTLPLRGDLGRICLGLCYPDGAGQKAAQQALRQSATTVEELRGAPLPWEDAARALVAGFQECLGVTFVQQDPHPAERMRAAELARERYAHPGWTERI
jgi:lipoate-protein ligase A